jgi:AraC-like DNA-binding protein
MEPTPQQVLNPAWLAALDLKILAVQSIQAGEWWNFHQVISPFSRLWLPLAGEAVVRQNDRTYKLVPGKLHLVPAYTHHDCRCTQRFDHFYLHFATRLPNGIDLFGLFDCDQQTPASPSANSYFQRLEAIYPNRRLPCFDPFREEYKKFPSQVEQEDHEAPPAEWFEAQGILRLLLAPFLMTAREHEGIHARVARRFVTVQEFIHEHMQEAISLSDLARVANLNPTYFSDRFFQLVGVRPMEYLMRRRIERAQYLLLTSTASIKEIASQVGMNDAAYFSRVFSRLCHSSPAAYRASHGV